VTNVLNLNHVQTLLKVVELGGFRAAARDLGVSASTVVEHVDQLEAEMAVRILVRDRGRMALTEQGRLFEPLALALMEIESQCHSLCSSRPLRVAAASNVGVYLLQPALASFAAAHDAAIEPWIGANPDVAERLECGRADVALMEWWDDRPSFAARAWRKEPMVLVAPTNHEWARRGEIDPEELARETLLGGEHGTGTGGVLRRALGPRAESLKVRSGYGSTEGVKRAVRAGLGVSIVLSAAVREEIADGLLASVTIRGVRLEKEIMIVSRSWFSASPSIQTLIAHLMHDAGA
jgi:DNA-binding transcriptional LysR family regulator